MRYVGKEVEWRGFIAAAIVCLTAAAGQAAEIAWRTDYDEAVHESARLKKPILIEVTAPWCGYCKQMFGQTFADQRVVEQVNRSFIPIRLDAARDSELVDALRVESFPATIVVASDRKILKRIAGFHPAEALLSQFSGVLLQASRDKDIK